MADLSITRFVPASPTEVWRSFTDVDRFTEWFWPPRLAPLCVLDVRPGGSWRVESSVAEMAVGGTYGELDETVMTITFTWQWDGEPDTTDVTVRFDADGERSTMLRVEHRGFDDDQRRDDHEQGWSDCLDRLPAVCAR